jgi:hypothetical protein
MLSAADMVHQRRAVHGFEWMVEVPSFLDDATIRSVIVTSANVAVREARQSGQNYVLASSLVPSRAVYVLAASHPRLVSHPQMTIRYEFTPSGQVIPVSPFQIKQAGKGRQN